jgi:hypothetical protein
VTRLLRTALGNRGIARLEAGWALASLGQWTFSITLALYAYYEDGPGGVALAVAVRMLPAALLAPLADRLVAGRGRRSVLAGSALLRCLLLEVFALGVAQEMMFGALLAFAAAFEVAGTVARPARATLLAALARTPQQLAAATAGRWVDNAGFAVGAVTAGVIVANGSLADAFAAAGAAFGVSALVAWRVPVDAVPATAAPAPRGLARDPWLRLRVGLSGAAMLAQSMLELLLVVAAIDLLGFGAEGVGWLRAAMAAGGVAGGAAAVALLRRGRLSAGVTAGLVLAGVPLALLAAWPAIAPGIVFLVLLGAGYAVFDSALLLLTQRLAPAASLQRVAAAEELVYPLARAAGTGLAAWLVVQYGDTAALVVGGSLLPLLALASLRVVRAADRRAAVPERPARLLRRVPALAALPLATIENLACCADRERFDVGGSIDGGFHVIDEGSVELRADGGPPERLGSGDSFGAGGLLPGAAPPTRAASAITPVSAFRIERADFMMRVTPPARASTRRKTE